MQCFELKLEQAGFSRADAHQPRGCQRGHGRNVMKTIRNRDVCLQQAMSVEHSATLSQAQPCNTPNTPADPLCCHTVPSMWQPGRGRAKPCGQASRQAGGLLRAAERRTAPGVGDRNGLPHQALCGADPFMVKHDLQGSMYLLSTRLVMGSINSAAQCCHRGRGPNQP